MLELLLSARDWVLWALVSDPLDYFHTVMAHLEK
jgi:hypothetical protein